MAQRKAGRNSEYKTSLDVSKAKQVNMLFENDDSLSINASSMELKNCVDKAAAPLSNFAIDSKDFKVLKAPKDVSSAVSSKEEIASKTVSFADTASTLSSLIKQAALYLFGDDDHIIEESTTPNSIASKSANSAKVVDSATSKIAWINAEQERVYNDDYRFSIAYLVDHKLLSIPVSQIEPVKNIEPAHKVQYCSLLNLLQDYYHSAFCPMQMTERKRTISPQEFCNVYQQLLEHEAIVQHTDLKKQQELSAQREQQYWEQIKQEAKKVHEDFSIMPYATVRNSPIHWGPILYNLAEFIFVNRHSLTKDRPEILQIRKNYEDAVHNGDIEYKAQLQAVLWPIESLLDDDDSVQDDVSAQGVQIKKNTASQGAAPVWEIVKVKKKARPLLVPAKNLESDSNQAQTSQAQITLPQAQGTKNADAACIPTVKIDSQLKEVCDYNRPHESSCELQLNAFLHQHWPEDADKSLAQVEMEERREFLQKQELIRQEMNRRSHNMDSALADVGDWLSAGHKKHQDGNTHANTSIAEVGEAQACVNTKANTHTNIQVSNTAIAPLESQVAVVPTQASYAFDGDNAYTSNGTDKNAPHAATQTQNAQFTQTVQASELGGMNKPIAAAFATTLNFNPNAQSQEQVSMSASPSVNMQDQSEAGITVPIVADAHMMRSAVPPLFESEYPRTESESSVQRRHEASFKLIREIGLVINDWTYKKYCMRMREQGFKPFAQEYLIKLNLVRVFIEKGYLSQRLFNYKLRAGQLNFINQVEIALARKQILMVEAGTGIGKTFSYLVPPILGARRVFVSTATKTLQDQLISNDMPSLVKMLNLPQAHYMALKGQNNYICRYLLEGGHAMSFLSQKTLGKCNSFVAEELDQIRFNRYQAGFGEIRFDMDEISRKAVTCDSKLCSEMHRICPFAQSKLKYVADLPYGCDNDPNEHCFVIMSREEAKFRNVVAINHALFFANEVSNSNLLQGGDVIVFDEAHSLPDVCREFFSTNVALGTLEDFPQKMQEAFKDSKKGKGKNKLVDGSEKRAAPVSLASGSIAEDLKAYMACVNILARMFRVWLWGLSQRADKHQESFRLPLQRLKYMHRILPSPLQLLGSYLLLPSELEDLGDKSMLVRVCTQRDEQEHKASGLGQMGPLMAGAGISTDLFGQIEDFHVQHKSIYEQQVELFRQEIVNKNRGASKIIDSMEESLGQLYKERLRERQAKYEVHSNYQEIGNKKIDYEVDVMRDSLGKLLVEPLFRALMADLWTVLASINKFLHKNVDINSDKINPVIDLCTSISEFIPNFMNADRDKNGELQEENVSLFDFNEKGFNLRIIPIDISKRLGDILRGVQKKGMSVILTSATITIEGRFDKYCRSIGLRQDEIMSAIIKSSFDYENNACLMISHKFPDPNDAQRIEKCIEQIAPAIDATPGGIFFLTTSYWAMLQARDILQRRFGAKRQVLMQGDKYISSLMSYFKQDGRAILVGTSSFWEGVDVPGKALSLVVIDKLPFKQISDPVLVARDKLYEKQGHSFFEEESLPDAVIKLRQGVGRLIRNENDRGCLIIMDPRMVTKKRYSFKFINSLPPMRIVDNVQEIVGFFRKNCL